MKNLLALLILLASSPSFAMFPSSLFGGLGQCGAPSMNSMLLPLLMMGQMGQPKNSVADIEAEIDETKERIKDLRSDVRSAQRDSAHYEMKAKQAEDRLAELGCTGKFKKDPLPCRGIYRKKNRMQVNAESALFDVEAMQDEIKEAREDLKDLREERREASKNQANDMLKQQMQQNMFQQMLAQSNSGGQQQMAGPAGFSNQTQPIAAVPQQFQGFQNMQASCPHCMVQANSSPNPGAGLANLSSHLSPVLNSQIRERNRQLGWPTTPVIRQPFVGQPVAPPIRHAIPPIFARPPMIAQPPMIGMQPNSVFGTNCFPTSNMAVANNNYGGAYGGSPAGGMFPGGAIAPVPTPFSTLPPMPVHRAVPPHPGGGLEPMPVAHGGGARTLAPIQVRSAR